MSSADLAAGGCLFRALVALERAQAEAEEEAAQQEATLRAHSALEIQQAWRAHRARRLRKVPHRFKTPALCWEAGAMISGRLPELHC
jgi:hypothetical protein